MKTEKWKLLNELFHQVIEVDADEREAFLTENCNGDQEIIDEIMGMVSVAEEKGDVLENPEALNIAGRMIFGEDLNGKRIGNYRIIREVGRGGMGAVFLAERFDREFDQKVAIKIVHDRFADQTQIERFRNERQILASLKHPNIAHLIDGGTTEHGLPYFVMEYVEGEMLLDYCDSNKLTNEERLDIFRMICLAVSHAHKNLIIHRDLKPSNILVTKEGIPKLLDFGIAKPFSHDSGGEEMVLTITGSRMLTPHYASPEQIRGETVTTSTDVYSLGVVLYELLTGHKPYSADSQNPLNALKLICEAEPVRPSSIVGITYKKENETTGAEKQTPISVSENRDTHPDSLKRQLQGDVDNILLKAIRKEPERRYDSVSEFVEDINRYQTGLPVKATADSTAYRLKKFVSRHKSGTVMAVGAILLMIFTTAVSSWQYFKAQKAQASAEQRFNDVRKLANSVVFEIHDSIENLPGSTPARELLVSRALEFLDQLANEAESNTELQTEVADAYDKIGDVQGGYGESHLGQREKAKKSYQKAFEIRKKLFDRKPDDVVFRDRFAKSNYKIGNVLLVETNLEESLKHFRRAFDICDELVNEYPDNTDFKLYLARAASRLGFIFAAKGDFSRGDEYNRQSIQIAENLIKQEPENERFLTSLAKFYESNGITSINAKREIDRGLEFFSKTERIWENLLAKNPNSISIKLNYAKISYAKGMAVYDIAGQDPPADVKRSSLKHLTKASEIYGELLSDDPKNKGYLQMYSNEEGLRGKLYTETGDPEKAVGILNKSLASLQRQREAAPNDSLLLVSIGVVYENLGLAFADIAKDEGRLKKDRQKSQTTACDYSRKSYDIFNSAKESKRLVSLPADKVEKLEKDVASCEIALAKLTGRN
ncbi:MAG: serine/threonine-protein kinase [Pyrinomonadaceae bacterium]